MKWQTSQKLNKIRERKRDKKSPVKIILIPGDQEGWESVLHSIHSKESRVGISELLVIA